MVKIKIPEELKTRWTVQIQWFEFFNSRPMILWFSGLPNKFSVSRCLHRRRWPVVSRKDRRETRKIDRYSFLQSNSAVSEDADRCQSNCSLSAECEWYTSLLRRRLWSLRGVVRAWSIMAGQVVCWYCPKKQIYLEYHDLDVKNMNIGPGEAIEMVWIGEKSNQMNRRQKIDRGRPQRCRKIFLIFTCTLPIANIRKQ